MISALKQLTNQVIKLIIINMINTLKQQKQINNKRYT